MKPSVVILRALFVGWFVATVAHQFARLRRYTGVISVQGMTLPIWTFFAPYPGSQDAELLFRTFDEETNPREWRHIEIYQQRRLSHLLLHTNRRLEKVVFDAVGEIRVLLRNHDNQGSIVASPAYLILLSVVLAQAELPSDAKHVQFMLIQSGGYDDAAGSLNPVFISDRHPLADRSAV